MGNISEKRNELEHARHELEEAQNEGNLEKAAALRYGKIPEIEKELKAIEEKAKSDDLSLVQESVTEEQITEVVGRMTGIPITKLVEGERENYFTCQKHCIKGSLDKMKLLKPYLMPLFVRVQEFKTLIVHLAHSSSSVQLG